MKKTYIFLIILLSAGFFIRLFPMRTGARYWDETVYLQDAERIAGKDSSNYTELDFRPPMLSLMGGAVFASGGGVKGFQILVVALSTFSIYLTYLIGRKLFSEEAGLVSAAVAAVSLVHFEISHRILVDPVLPVFWLLSFYAVSEVVSGDGGKLWRVAAGFFTAMAVLTKFTSLAILGAALTVFYLYSDSFWKDAEYYIVAFILALLPYMSWNVLSFGNPLHTFIKGLQLSGATDGFFTYLRGLWRIVPLPFLAVSGYFVTETGEDLRNAWMLLIFILVLALPLQCLIGNKELRFLLPIMPFIAIISGRQATRFFGGGKKMVALVLGMLLLSAVPLATSDYGRAISKGRLEMKEEIDVIDASIWLSNSTGKEALVYTNYEWPIISYYSERNIRILPTYRPFQHDFERFMQRPGYLVYQSYSPKDDFRKEFLERDARFELNRSFSNSVHIYYYGGPER